MNSCLCLDVSVSRIATFSFISPLFINILQTNTQCCTMYQKNGGIRYLKAVRLCRCLCFVRRRHLPKVFEIYSNLIYLESGCEIEITSIHTSSWMRFRVTLQRQLAKAENGSPSVGKDFENNNTYRHLREIDCSLAIVGGPATGAECGGKSIHLPHIQRQKVLYNAYCGWRHNNYCQQRQAGRANEQSTSLRCLCLNSKRQTLIPMV